MYKFEEVYETLVGLRDKMARVPGVEDISAEGTPFAKAYQNLWDSRISLGKRFGVDFEDQDLERIMHAVQEIEKEIARHMYHYGAQFAEKE